MSDSRPIGLTGEGFSREEADDFLRDCQLPEMTPEERKKYLADMMRVFGLAPQAQEDSPEPGSPREPTNLTGEGFSIEEAQECSRDCQLPSMTPEEREAEIAFLERTSAPSKQVDKKPEPTEAGTSS